MILGVIVALVLVLFGPEPVRGNMNMDMLKLKNGSEEDALLVTATIISVEHLRESNPIAFVELVSLCRDRDHKLFGNTAVELQGLALVDTQRDKLHKGCFVHRSIRNIVLSAVEGEGFEMIFISPLAEGRIMGAMAKKGAVGLRRVMRQLKRDAHKYEDCRIMWHAVKTKATGYGTAWLTRDECRAAINSMEHRQNHQVATGEGERLLWWSIDTREGE